MKVVIYEYSSMVLSLVTLFGVIGVIDNVCLGETGIFASLIYAAIGGA